MFDPYEENERIAWIVENIREVPFKTEQVTKGLPLTRKNLRFEDGKSTVTLRSLKDEILWLFCESGDSLFGAEIVKSGLKVW